MPLNQEMYILQIFQPCVNYKFQGKIKTFKNVIFKGGYRMLSGMQSYSCGVKSKYFSKFLSNSKYNCLSSHFFLEEKYKVKPPCRLKILSEFFGSSKKISALFKEEPRLAYCDPFNLQRNISTLKLYGITSSDMSSQLAFLCWKPLTVEHHIQMLHELMIRNPIITHYRSFTGIMKRPIKLLKAHGLIAEDYAPFEILNKMGCSEEVLEHLNLPTSIEDLTLAKVHQELSLTWLCWRLDCDRQKIEHIRKVYPQTIPKSMVLQNQFFNMLEDHFDYCNDKILRNGFLLNGSPANLRLIMQELQCLLRKDNDGIELSQIAGYSARILITPHHFLIYIDRILQQLKISSHSLIKLPGIYTLHPNTVVNRINELQKFNEFKSFENHPRMIRTIYYNKKIKSRMDLVKKSDVKKLPSLNILTGSNAQFYKYITLGELRTNKRDLATFLAEYFSKEKSIVMELLNNKNLPQTTVVDAQENIEFLIKVGFSCEQVWENVDVVVYQPELLHKEFEKVCMRINAQNLGEIRNNVNFLQLLLYFLNKATFKS